MNIKYADNNHLVLMGKVTSEKRFSHEIYGESFYIFDMEVPRLSDTQDIIPVTISERLIPDGSLEIGKKVLIKGQFRSYNSYENERNKLILTVFAKDIFFEDEIESQVSEEENKEIVSNEVILTGYICKKPIYRQTPFGREIADLLLAVNRAYNKSDYIPAIAWGRTARFCQNIDVGTEVKVTGRVQSRTYEKKFEDGTSETRVAYEVSVASLEVVEEKQDAELTNARRSQVGSGDRSEKIRTYNFPQGRITDHRIGMSIYQMEDFLNGNLDGMIDALITADTAEKLKGQNE